MTKIPQQHQPKGNLTKEGLEMLPRPVLVSTALKLDEEKADLEDKLKKAQIKLEQVGL